MPAKIDFSQVRVLIVDPNPLSIELTCDVLAMMGGLTARRCLTTDRALHVLRSEPVDIVITEWNTAPLNGLQFIDYVRNSPQSPNRLLPILLMTARSEQPYVVQARDRQTERLNLLSERLCLEDLETLSFDRSGNCLRG